VRSRPGTGRLLRPRSVAPETNYSGAVHPETRVAGAVCAIVERCFERRLEALDLSDASATSWSAAALASPPAERRGDLGQDGPNDMRIVGDAKLVRDCEE
jgi:hypothetical protein